MANPDYMVQTPDKPMIHLEERQSGMPEAMMKTGIYPGDNTGWAFVYPKGR